MNCWYVVFTKPRQEDRAKRNLEIQGLSAYLPMIPTKKKTARIACKEPMFPRYLFIYIDHGSIDFSSIQYTRGVVDFVRFGERPAILNEGVLDSVKINERAINSISEKQRKILLGVESNDYPVGVCTSIYKRSRDERVSFLLDTLHKNYRKQFPKKQQAKNRPALN